MDTSSTPSTDPIPVAADSKDGALSDNISLFQSLRVLQEGEDEGDDKEPAVVSSKIIKQDYI